jgi:hypothetical protein
MRLTRSIIFTNSVHFIYGRAIVVCDVYWLSVRVNLALFMYYNLKHAWSACPVLKHGPRSLTCTRVIGNVKPKGIMKVKIHIVDLRRDHGFI